MQSTLEYRNRSPLPRSWLAVKGKPSEAILDALRLRKSRLSSDDSLKFEIVGAPSDAGWYLIVARGRDHQLIREAAVQPLSEGCEVLTCTAHESAMFSSAAGWRNGARVWSVSYDGEDGPGDVVAEGDLPASAPEFRKRLSAEAQAEDAGDALVDPMYEIPIEIVHSVIGYRPGVSSPAFEGRFMLLEGQDRSWWKRIFGGA
jgi:hypothetical protein